MKSRGLTVAVFFISLAGIYWMQTILNPLLMAIFITIVMIKPIAWLQKKLPYSLVVTLTVLAFMALYLGFAQLISGSVSRFMESSDKYNDRLSELSASFSNLLAQNGIGIESLVSGAPDPSEIMSTAMEIFGGIGDVLGDEFTFLLFTIFLISELKDNVLKINYLTQGNEKSLAVLQNTGDKIRHYLSIKTVTSLLTGLLVGIGLAIIGVDFYILWGILAFLLNYIPNIGSIIAAIPAVILALIQLGVKEALITAVIYVIVNMVIGNIVDPKMMGKGLGVSTFMVFLSLIFWGFLLGPVGMFLSVPLTMVVKIIAEQSDDWKWLAVVLGTSDDVTTIDEKVSQK